MPGLLYTILIHSLTYLSFVILIDTLSPFLAVGTSRWLFSMHVTRPTSNVSEGIVSNVPVVMWSWWCCNVVVVVMVLLVVVVIVGGGVSE